MVPVYGESWQLERLDVNHMNIAFICTNVDPFRTSTVGDTRRTVCVCVCMRKYHKFVCFVLSSVTWVRGEIRSPSLVLSSAKIVPIINFLRQSLVIWELCILSPSQFGLQLPRNHAFTFPLIAVTQSTVLFNLGLCLHNILSQMNQAWQAYYKTHPHSYALTIIHLNALFAVHP